MIGDWIFGEPFEMLECSKRDMLQVYEEYFSLVRSMASSCLFDVLGHPDLIKIFGVQAEDRFFEHFVGNR